MDQKDLEATKKRSVLAFDIAEKINDALYSDSRVRVEEHRLAHALFMDLEKNGDHRLTDEEIEELVMGDDDGEIPDRLIKLYPNVNAVLNEMF